MEKALHDYFYIATDGKLTLYSKEDASFLIEVANNHLDRRLGKHITAPHIPDMAVLDAFIYECMVEYFKNGESESLIELLNRNIQNISNQCLVERTEKGLVTVHVGRLPFNPPQEIFGACMFSNIASLGGFEGLKRCQSTDCQKFFIGRSNVKWCSKTCGSRCRVKKMRKEKIV
ncbi:MAG: CGNR zinc finger domain-containing protein [Candidatus Berkiella sp.]